MSWSWRASLLEVFFPSHSQKPSSPRLLQTDAAGPSNDSRGCIVASVPMHCAERSDGMVGRAVLNASREPPSTARARRTRPSSRWSQHRRPASVLQMGRRAALSARATAGQ
eukprot:scaffold3537_cov373-Prasinococcus_capsulatus_cf.AAC.2